MYCCPQCKDSESLSVDATVDASVDAEGTLELLGTDLHFDESSTMFCGGCGFSGPARKFDADAPPLREMLKTTFAKRRSK